MGGVGASTVLPYILLLCLCPDISTKRTLLLLNPATGLTNLALVSFYCPPATSVQEKGVAMLKREGYNRF